MGMVGDCRKEIVDTHQFVGKLYESKYSDIFEAVGRLYEIPKSDLYENNPFLGIGCRGLHDPCLM